MKQTGAASAVSRLETETDYMQRTSFIRKEEGVSEWQLNEPIATIQPSDDVAAACARIDVLEEKFEHTNDDGMNECAKNARSWFGALSRIEQCACLGFVDGRFFSTIKIVLSSSWSTKGSSMNEQNADARSFDWMTQVDLREIETVYDSQTDFQDENDTDSNLEANMLAKTDDLESNSGQLCRSCNIESGKDEISGNFRKDPTRIRNKGGMDSRHHSEDIAVETSIFDKSVAIFPSAFHAVTGKKVGDSVPFVTLDISLHDDNSEDVLSLLDRYYVDHIGSRFMSTIDDNELPLSKAWLRRLQSRNSLTKVSVGALLLARIEHAALTIVSANKVTNPLVKDQSVGNCFVFDSSAALSHLLNDVLCYSRSLNEITLSLDSPVMHFSMEPFVKLFPIQDDGKLFSPKILASTPLKLLFLYENRSTVYKTIDEGIEASLLLIKKYSFEKIAQEQACEEFTANGKLEPRNGTDTLGSLSSAENGSLYTASDEVAANTDAQIEDIAKAVIESENRLNHQQQSNHTKTSKKKKKKKSKRKKNRKPAGNANDSFSVNQNYSPKYGEDDNDNDDQDNDPSDEQGEIVEELDTEEMNCHLDITSPKSFDSADSEISEKGSVKSDASLYDTNLKNETGDNITVSRFDGKIIVSPVIGNGGSGMKELKNDDDACSKNNPSAENDDEDVWETVEARSKANRKKGGDKAKNTPPPFSSTINANDSSVSNGKKAKGCRTPISRKKSSARKTIRESQLSAIDTVEDDSRKKKAATHIIARPIGNPWKNGPPGSGTSLLEDSLGKGMEAPKRFETPKKTIEAPSKPTEAPKKSCEVPTKGCEAPKIQKTLRDVLLGTHLKATNVESFPTATKTGKVLVRTDEAAKVDKKEITADVITTQTRIGKANTAPTADQNTAPTYQETVSAVSTASNLAPSSKPNTRSEVERIVKSDSSSGETEDVPLNRTRKASIGECNDESSTPPLPTLLSPENANSSTSSVASSLEAPRAVHAHHHSKSAPSTNDVGYHLLDVCDKLSRDMNLFMSRRALSLNPRRRERCALLAALQDSVSSLWPGRCHAELYGSCAIQLDLPSSDLDVVVVGLDRVSDIMLSQSLPLHYGNRTSSFNSDNVSSISKDDNALPDDDQSVSRHLSVPIINPYVLMHSQLNGERVMLLAAKLEAQPWAVQVKAIPTASVPVVKILADPSRLIGSSFVPDWTFCHPVSQPQAGVLPGVHAPVSVNEFNTPSSFLPWRGSDIVKGLHALDITFEGPEHGGIGSTEFSSLAIEKACMESGLHPEATPFVQVLLVLKELLAQRKLNEPYSGGLSSYALLLLVLAVLRERSVIREEIERVERQRKAMATVDGESFRNPSFHPSTVNDSDICADNSSGDADQDRHCSVPIASPIEANSAGTSNISAKIPFHKEPAQQQTVPSSSNVVYSKKTQMANSWVNVAKKASAAKATSRTTHNILQPKPPSAPQENGKPLHETKSVRVENKPSFADAVAGTLSKKQSADNDPPPLQNELIKSTAEKGCGQADVNRHFATVDSSADIASTHDAHLRNNEISASKSDVAQLNTTEKSNSEKHPYNRPLQPNLITVTPCKQIPDMRDNINGSPDVPTQSNNHVGTNSVRDCSTVGIHAFYPQGVNDIIEVLCSGEPTAGKILMHFLLFYGQYFDAQTTAIDISGKHSRESMPYSQQLSPFIQRRAPGSIDPITGMLIVDPIVIYDPLEGAENNNVARRCYAWNSVRWIFAQSYATLISAVERSATPPSSPVKQPQGSCTASSGCFVLDPISATSISDGAGDPWDPSSPLLSCLLSF